jgi:hypothetical protein
MNGRNHHEHVRRHRHRPITSHGDAGRPHPQDDHRRATQVSTFIARVARHGRTLAHTTLTIIGSPAGYQMGLSGIRSMVTSVWRGLKVTATRITRTAGKVTEKAIGLIGTVSPALGTHLIRATNAITSPIVGAARTAGVWVETAGELVRMLASTDLVRTCTTRAALAAVTLISLHALTQGTLAARIVQALPWTMDAIITITNPTRAPGVRSRHDADRHGRGCSALGSGSSPT